MRRNILITGASSGLGRQMALDFADLGRNLALVARRTDELADLREQILARDPDLVVQVRQLDVTDTDAVFDTFRSLAGDFAGLGGLDRIIVNAGIGKGHPLGKGRFDANAATAQTNFVAALAQIEGAMELFRAQQNGHLVIISSVSAVRGMPGAMTTYAATKAGISALAQGLRVELGDSPIRVSTIRPGYIATEMNAGRRSPLMVDTAAGVRAMVRAIEKERAIADVPAWPWVPVSAALRLLPDRLVARMV